MDKVRKDAAAEVEQEAADSKAAQSEQAAEYATDAREGAEEQQVLAAKKTAVAEAAGQAAVDDAREAEKAAKKTAAGDARDAGHKPDASPAAG